MRTKVNKQPDPNGKRTEGQIISPDPSFLEIGSTGLLRYAGYVNEEFHRDLQGAKALKIYKEMLLNSPTVGAALRAVSMLMRGVSWRVEPGGDSNEDNRAKELVETGIHDMSFSWHDTLSEVFTCLPMGFAYHEIVYKRREGQQGQPGMSSKYDDGLIGWRKLPIRTQSYDQQSRWEFDESGGIKGMYQYTVDKPSEIFIPIEKALLFRTDVHKNNPEGLSILRSAYVPWYFLKRIMEIEAIGIERDLAGYPMGFVPAELLSATRSSAQSTTYNALKNMVVNIRRDEQEGGLWPMAYDPQGKPLYDFKLLSTGGQRQFNTTEVIQRYQRDIAMSVMADFLFLGREAVGSYALASSKTTLFAAALGAWLDQIADVFNRHAIPRLLGYNGFRLEKLPELKHGDIETMPVDELASMITALSGAGARLFPDLDLENYFRTLMSWPLMTEEEAERRETEALQTEASRAELAPWVLAEERRRVAESEAKQELMGAFQQRQEADAKGKPVVEQTEKREPQPINLTVHPSPAPNVTVEGSMVHLQPHITVGQPEVKVDPPHVIVNTPAVTVRPEITVQAPSVQVQPPNVQVTVPVTLPKSGPKRYTATQKDGQTIVDVIDGG